MNLNSTLVCWRAASVVRRSYRQCNYVSYSNDLRIKFLIRKQELRYYSDKESEDIMTDISEDFIQKKTRLGSFTKRSSTLAGIASKYKIFQNSESPVILDVDEERQLRLENPELFIEIQPKTDPFEGMNLESKLCVSLLKNYFISLLLMFTHILGGKSGVFEVEELVEVLRNENMKDIITIAVPLEFQYVDYIIIITGRSQKHNYSIAEFIKKLFKRKMHNGDNIPVIEGGKENNWLAMDLGLLLL